MKDIAVGFLIGLIFIGIILAVEFLQVVWHE